MAAVISAMNLRVQISGTEMAESGVQKWTLVDTMSSIKGG
jgi:hypothetical protein